MKPKRNNRHLSFHSLIVLFFIFHFSIFNSITAQQSDFIVHRQQRIILPHHVGSVSCLDSNFYCYASGVLLKAQRSGDRFVNFRPDTTLVKLDADIDYVVRHPSTGDLYFTTLDQKGRSYLFRCHIDKEGKQKIKQVKMDGGFLSKGMNVFHPTFTADGTLMVFSSSREDRNKGSLDLWYSRFNGEEWSDPTNLGNRINTSGDEITPFIYRDCLLFASNGNADDYNRFALYATRLISDPSRGDSVRGRMVGRCLVQRLPAPFNVTGTDNLGLSFDLISGNGFWISNRDDASGRQLYACPGPLEGMLLWGTLSDPNGHPLAGVRVAALQDGNTLCSATSDANGYYNLYLQCNQHYDISFRLQDYFVTVEPLNTLQGDEGYLITEKQHNVKLHGLPIGYPFHLEDLFGPDADVELSAHGKELLQPLVQFLVDNPTRRATLTLTNDLTDDPSFNSLLTDSRVRSLEKHLRESLPETVKFTINNGCDGMERCSTATGSSILTILINK